MREILESLIGKPMYRYLKKILGRRVVKRAITYALVGELPCRVVIGASGVAQQGWIPTEEESLNILKVRDWERYFKNCEVDALLAEHVWEHLTEEQ
ncbi:MAG: hypothetical protein Q8P39_03370, partial [Candidatus Yanofskybacteria bacterium]|nr:hypothetical protein [Candidatus Yanofskybacteria bacterium]